MNLDDTNEYGWLKLEHLRVNFLALTAKGIYDGADVAEELIAAVKAYGAGAKAFADELEEDISRWMSDVDTMRRELQQLHRAYLALKCPSNETETDEADSARSPG